MNTIDLPIEQLVPAPWNPNCMDAAGKSRLMESLSRYGQVEPLVVRPMAPWRYEVINGNQRLDVLRDMGMSMVPCVVVDLGDADAMLLAEALNTIKGNDDLGIKAALLKKVLATVPEDRILSLLPETAKSLQALSIMGQDDLAQHLEAWQKAQAARLRHLQLQLTREQLEVVEKALDLVMARAKYSADSNPNIRGTAVYLLAKFYLERKKKR